MIAIMTFVMFFRVYKLRTDERTQRAGGRQGASSCGPMKLARPLRALTWRSVPSSRCADAAEGYIMEKRRVKATHCGNWWNLEFLIMRILPGSFPP